MNSRFERTLNHHAFTVSCRRVVEPGHFRDLEPLRLAIFLRLYWLDRCNGAKSPEFSFRERPDDILSQSGSQLTNYQSLNKVGF